MIPTEHLLRADELGLRLEIVNGLAIWEAMPPYRHQKHAERIAARPARHRPGNPAV